MYNESLCFSLSITAYTPPKYAVPAVPLLVVAVRGMDEGLEGRVTCRITLNIVITKREEAKNQTCYEVVVF